MPRVFDNINESLLAALRDSLGAAERSDFSVGYFNLRGWRQLDAGIENWKGGPGHCCRLLVGIQPSPEARLRDAYRPSDPARLTMDRETAARLRRDLAREFRRQLMIGAPTSGDEAGLRRLTAQIRAGKVVVKFYLRHPLHAKLYLLFPPDRTIGYVGSSDLTLPALSQQGELNVDVTDDGACALLAKWFEDRWNDRWCIDISDELATIIDESWAGDRLVKPYHVYVKMAWHLSQEAQSGLRDFRIPSDFGHLFDYQQKAVVMAAAKLNKRGGVLIGDVVGLGKTLMAVCLARIFEDDQGLETLILCPKNLVPMWEDYAHRYRMRGAKVMSITRMTGRRARKLRRYRQVIIDESHNLRNREGKRYNAIQDYLRRNGSRVILLSATPYNKAYTDLSNQLRLFVEEDADIGIRPEKLLREIGLPEFRRLHQCPERSLSAFEKSESPDDWRDLMRLFLVRRTRGFILDNYAKTDADGRKYLEKADGGRTYFPTRLPRRAAFDVDPHDPRDQYARLFSPRVVDVINDLDLPRYGLGKFVRARPLAGQRPDAAEAALLDNLSRAGKRLMGFCRTNLFKRLESSGHAFIQSVQRHVLRNFIYLHATDAGKPIPVGTQDVGLLDPDQNDEDFDLFGRAAGELPPMAAEADYRARAAEVYETYAADYASRFRWLRPALFDEALGEKLLSDAKKLMSVLTISGPWDPDSDAKLRSLLELVTKRHGGEKVLVFTQFADTVRYLRRALTARGIGQVAGVTGQSSDPTETAHRFSPVSNGRRDEVPPAAELRVLVATDVLSEGQNLQDAGVLVNYDLPWAIIRLIQRAGRIDRIGQLSPEILCYSFMPADGVENIIHLRSRVARRLRENAEVLGSDERFMDDAREAKNLRDLFTEKAGSLDGADDREVDLESEAFQIWKNAIDRDPKLESIIRAMPNVVYATRAFDADARRRHGVLVYLRTTEEVDHLAWIDAAGKTVTESQVEILRAAACGPGEPALPRRADHHELVQTAIDRLREELRAAGGQLGGARSARKRVYDRLQTWEHTARGTLFHAMADEVRKVMDDLYRYPLRPVARDTLNGHLRTGIGDESLVSLVVNLRREGRLCKIDDGDEDRDPEEPEIICSMGLTDASGRQNSTGGTE